MFIGATPFLQTWKSIVKATGARPGSGPRAFSSSWLFFFRPVRNLQRPPILCDTCFPPPSSLFMQPTCFTSHGRRGVTTVHPPTGQAYRFFFYPIHRVSVRCLTPSGCYEKVGPQFWFTQGGHDFFPPPPQQGFSTPRTSLRCRFSLWSGNPNFKTCSFQSSLMFRWSGFTDCITSFNRRRPGPPNFAP